MAVSCPEVMYGAYYPYLYGRGAATSRFHHAPHFQYDRLNVQSGAGSDGYGGAGGGGAPVSSGSASSGAQSPGSPHAHHHHHRLRTKEEDHSRASNDGGGSSESEGECVGAGGAAGGRARAQYVSANCVVFTHYSGDVAAVVDDHFARALAQDKHKGTERADGVPQPAGVVLQRGAGRRRGGHGRRRGGRGRRVRRRRAVRVRSVAPALRLVRARGAVPRGAGAPLHGGGRLPGPAAAPLAPAPPVQAGRVGAPRARAARRAPRPRRLFALLLPGRARSGGAGAGHVEGSLLVLRVRWRRVRAESASGAAGAR